MALRQTAGLIWAAIFVVALQLIADVAFAHPGHAHHSSVPIASGPEAPLRTAAVPIASSPGTPLRTAAIPDDNRVSSYQHALASMPAQVKPVCVRSPACAGGCCGTQAGCCGAALLAPVQLLPDISNVADFVSLVTEKRVGIDPDGLARPPRTFA
jgi:hypothetical protein